MIPFYPISGNLQDEYLDCKTKLNDGGGKSGDPYSDPNFDNKNPFDPVMPEQVPDPACTAGTGVKPGTTAFVILGLLVFIINIEKLKL